MAYKHYLLGVLADKPMAGYSLYKFFFEPFGRPLSQIYRTLHKMTEEGLVAVEKVTQDKLPSQNLYYITEAGNAELVRWLKHQPHLKRTTENELIGRLWFGSKADEKYILKHLESFSKYAENHLNFFKNQAKPKMEARAMEQGSTLDLVCRLMVIEYGVRQYETALEWVRTALDKIKSITQSEGKAGTTEVENRETPER